MIFTIGYSNRSIGEFSREIECRDISQIVDVRSSPWSRNPHFTRERLQRWSERSAKMYRWEGAVLGGRSTFAPDTQPYRSVLESLIATAMKEHIVLLCAEGEPEECHRCYDVGAALFAFCDIQTVNIRRDGRDEKIAVTLKRILPSRMHPSVLRGLPPPLGPAVEKRQKSWDF